MGTSPVLWSRRALFAMLGVALASAAAVAFTVAPAAAAPGSLCNVVALLCPPTTVAKATPTTKPAPTTTATTPAPAAAHPTSSKATATAPSTTTTTAPKTPPSAPSQLGVAGLSLSPAALGDLTGASGDAAPQLATPAPTAAVGTQSASPAPGNGFVATLPNPSRGLPNNHAAARIALSLVVLVIAGTAVAQLPAARRSTSGSGSQEPAV